MAVTIDAYLNRLGLRAPIPATAQGLETLQRAHLYSVPFENLDIHRGVPIVLELEAILDKIVKRRRGGFCYELNSAFAWLLCELGFEVDLLSANVSGNSGWGIDFDHMLLSVRLQDTWLADVGFGDSFVEPLRWRENVLQVQAAGAFRLDREGDFWILARSDPDGSGHSPQYRFLERVHELADFAPGCAYHQTSKSHFTDASICSLARPDGRVTLRADRLITTRGADKLETPIPDRAAWQAALREHFGIELD